MRTARIVLLACSAVALLGGCQPLASQGWSWLFSLAVPLVVFFVVGASVVWWCRERALKGWDLQDSPSPPASLLPSVVMGIVAAVVAVLFSLYNLLDMDAIPPEQRWSNIGCWCLGTILGVLAAHPAGVWRARKRYTRGNDG